MTEEKNPPAFHTVDEVRAALTEGIAALKRLADEARHDITPDELKGTQLDFCEGCLIDLKDSLTMSPRGGRNSGCL